VDVAIGAFGRLDGLVNNAGVFYVAAPEEDDPARAAEMVAVNLLGTIYCGLAAARHMVVHRGGAIVNDTSGAQSGMSRRGAYGATKGATASLTYSWAMDLQVHGVRVNAVSPIARTAMVDYGVALGERGTEIRPEHVAPLVTYLMSDAAAAVTGQVIRFDGPELSVLSRPGAQRRVARSDGWDYARIAAVLPTLLD
jgi:NAD(P)-dependent dehydrogenase (short-subunit alcohol dehydrogenase family)